MILNVLLNATLIVSQVTNSMVWYLCGRKYRCHYLEQSNCSKNDEPDTPLDFSMPLVGPFLSICFVHCSNSLIAVLILLLYSSWHISSSLFTTWSSELQIGPPTASLEMASIIKQVLLWISSMSLFYQNLNVIVFFKPEYWVYSLKQPCRLAQWNCG